MQVSSATVQDVLSSQNEITDCEGGKKFNFYQLERRRESAHASGRLRQVLESGILGWELGAGGSSDILDMGAQTNGLDIGAAL